MQGIFFNGIAVLASIIFFQPLIAQVQVAPVFSSNMVLQQNRDISVWGVSTVGDTITIQFNGKKYSTTTDSDGNWFLKMVPISAKWDPLEMIIEGNSSKQVLDNILIGEVWLASGQSNMEYAMVPYHTFAPPERGIDLAKVELNKAEQPRIRVLNCDKKAKEMHWEQANGVSLKATSQVGYFFGKKILENLDVPIGIITSAVGGTQIETWTPTEAYASSKILSEKLKQQDGKLGGKRPGNWYTQMIAPLIPFSIRGVLWYQGENNCAIGDNLYAEKFKVLTTYWRQAFNNAEMPFYYVVLAPHTYSDRVHGKSSKVTAEALPLFREQQINAKELVDHSDYIIISDLIDGIDGIDDIHPPYKWEVGERLANLALNQTYNKNSQVYSGPRIKEVKRDDNSLVLTFDFCYKGLKTIDDKRLSWFEIAGKDGVFKPALADIIDSNKIVVYHPELQQPCMVRIGWNERAIPNLVNSANLPVAPFQRKVQD